MFIHSMSRNHQIWTIRIFFAWIGTSSEPEITAQVAGAREQNRNKDFTGIQGVVESLQVVKVGVCTTYKARLKTLDDWIIPLQFPIFFSGVLVYFFFTKTAVRESFIKRKKMFQGKLNFIILCQFVSFFCIFSYPY